MFVLLCSVGVISCDARGFKIVIRYPASSSVNMYIRGQGVSSLSWDQGVRATKVNDSTWTLEVSTEEFSNNTSSVPEFKCLLEDSTWQIGANELLADTPAAIVVFPWFKSKEGRVDTFANNLYSPQLNNTRDVVTYFPPSFEENTLKCLQNVLVMHDGNNLFSSLDCPTCCPNGCWNIDSTLDELIVGGHIEEVAVFGVFNTAQRLSEYTYSQDPQFSSYPAEADAYLDFLEVQLMTMIQKNLSDRLCESASWGILGSSLGGLVSAYAGWTRPGVWNVAGVMSASFWWNSEDFNRIILRNGTASRSKDQNTVFYIDSGTGNPPDSDDDEFETIRVYKSLEALGKAPGSSLFYALDNGGQHSEASWGARFWKPMTDLYPSPAGAFSPYGQARKFG
eukprot:g2062.t1